MAKLGNYMHRLCQDEVILNLLSRNFLYTFLLFAELHEALKREKPIDKNRERCSHVH